MAYHDARPHPEPGQGPYVAVCNVRPDGSRPEGFDAYDDDGGFPDRNVAYCELSVLRRLETRATTDLVGLCHYRRVFLGRHPRVPRAEYPNTFLFPRWDWNDIDGHSAAQSDLLAALGGRDWATPAPYDVRRAGFRSLAQQFAVNHRPELLTLADRAIVRRHRHLPSFGAWLHTCTATPLFNMFLGRRELLAEYAAFLWPILDECGAGYSPDPANRYQSRWAGFLAERLHGYWIEHVAVAGGAQVATLPVGLLDPVGIGKGQRCPSPRPRMSWAVFSSTAASLVPDSVLLWAHEAKWLVRPRSDPRDRGGRG